MFEYENKLEVLGDIFPDPENWVVYLDPENEQPNIVSSKVRDEWIFQDFHGKADEFLKFYITGRIGRHRSGSVNITSLVKYHLNKYNLWS